MDISETDLPGVGKRFELGVGGGERVVIVIHNTGRRELFVRPEPGADAESVLDLTDQESRVVGSILEGAYFQPVTTDTTGTKIGDNAILEWYTLGEESSIVGQSIEEAGLRNATGVTIAAIERDEDVLPSPDPGLVFEAGDKLVVIGTGESHERFADEAM